MDGHWQTDKVSYRADNQSPSKRKWGKKDAIDQKFKKPIFTYLLKYTFNSKDL